MAPTGLEGGMEGREAAVVRFLGVFGVEDLVNQAV